MNTDKLHNGNMNEKQLDAFLKKSIRAKFDEELRKDLENTLRNKYQYTKGGKVVSLSQKNRTRLYRVLSAAAVVLILIIASPYLFKSSSNDPQTLAVNFLNTTTASHGGAKKGNTSTADIRQEAITAYNTREYVLSEQLFAQIEEKTTEDQFYLALSLLYNQKYSQGTELLENIINIPNSAYNLESRWYLAIGYILTGEEAKAKELLQKMSPDDWNYDKTQALLKSLN